MISESQHFLSAGVLCNDTIKSEKQIGSGYYVAHPDKPYFKLQLWQQPEQPFYVVKNKNNENYTLFSKMIDEEEMPTFQRPVGYGNIKSSMRDTLILQFNFPWQRCFLSLHPENKGSSRAQ